MKDWRGTEIKVGSVVVYPVRFSSSMDVIEAEVVEIGTSESEYRASRPALKVRRLRETGHVGFKGQEELPFRERTWSPAPEARALQSKLVTLTELARVTVVG